jgi:hypothetical protein
MLWVMFGILFLKTVGRSVAESLSSSMQTNAFGASLGNSNYVVEALSIH